MARIVQLLRSTSGPGVAISRAQNHVWRMVDDRYARPAPVLETPRCEALIASSEPRRRCRPGEASFATRLHGSKVDRPAFAEADLEFTSGDAPGVELLRPAPKSDRAAHLLCYDLAKIIDSSENDVKLKKTRA